MHKTLPSDTVCSYCIHGQIYGQVFPISSCHRDVQSPSRRTMSSSIRQPWETKWSTGFMFRVSWTIYVNVDSPNLGFPYFNFLGGGQLKKSPCIWKLCKELPHSVVSSLRGYQTLPQEQTRTYRNVHNQHKNTLNKHIGADWHTAKGTGLHI